MKTRIVMVITAAILILSSCGEKTETANVDFRGLSFTADILYLNSSYIADCVINDAGEFTAIMRAPDSIKDLELTFTENGSKVIYRGIEIADIGKIMPQNCSVSMIYDALFNGSGVVTETKKANSEINGKIGEYEYIITTSPGGLPISLEIKDYGMTVVFNNVRYN